jgi:hypothetical protein
MGFGGHVAAERKPTPRLKRGLILAAVRKEVDRRKKEIENGT